MNFMPGRPGGFYEEITGAGNRGMSSATSSSSSPSSSLQPKGLPLFTYHHQEAYGGGGAGASQLPDSSPTNPDEAVDDSDDHMFIARRGGGEGSSTTAAGTAAVIEREHMFDKVVTPSDVGKLNRLVIPKQHAEKYFPLDSSTNEKGLLLNFEDRNGKPWRFRYSYWNSSQSYVMTKGWSRFVKEKKLDAGDIVSFQRGVGELGKDRLFIDWRRRPDAPDLQSHHIPTLSIPHQFSFQRSSIHPWNNPLFLQPPPPPPSRDYYNAISSTHHHQMSGGYGGPYAYGNVVNGNPCPPGSIVYLRSAAAPGGGGVYSPQQQVGMGMGMGIVQAAQRGSSSSGGGLERMVYESVPVVQGKAAAKRLRLFGVNMDCPISDSDPHPDNMLLSSSSTTSSTMPILHQMLPPPSHHPPYYNNFDSSSSSPPPSVPSLQLGRSNYNNSHNDDDDDDEGKGTSMSLDLDI